jgi:hypothetical protein
MSRCGFAIRRTGWGMLPVAMVLAWMMAAPRAFAQQPSAPAAPGSADSTAPQLSALADQLERYARFVSAMEGTLDRTTFQPQTIVQLVGADPAKLCQWVREQTHLLPYAGSLRGPVGVLMDRSGNSLDRALLLADLFRWAGIDYRLAHGTLSDEQARHLIESSATTRPTTPADATDDQNKNIIGQIAAKSGVSPEQVAQVINAQQLESEKLQEDLVNTVTDEAARLNQLLSTIPAPRTDASDPAVAAKDHWWVQFSSGGTWVDADPQASPGKTLCVASETFSAMPNWNQFLASRKLLHEVAIRVRIERIGAKGPEQLTALERSFAPAQLAGQALSLAIVPIDWPGELDLSTPDAPAKLKAALLAQHSWLPMITVGEQRLYDKSFDESGNLDAKPALDAIGKAGGKVKSAAQRAADLFGSGLEKASQPTATLTRVWVEFDIRPPGQKVQTIRRDLYNLELPSAAKHSGNTPPQLAESDQLRRSAALYHSMDLLPAGCIFSRDFVSVTAISEIKRMAPVAAGTLRQAAVGDLAQALQKFGKFQPQPVQLLALASLREGPPGLAGGVAVDRPNLFALHHGLNVRPDGTFTATNATDIIASQMAALSGPDAFAGAVRQGVLETYLESSLAGGTRNNTSALFAAPAARATPWKLIRAAADPSLAQSGLSELAKARIGADLASGFIVVAPQKSITLSGRELEGWWRIDPATGNTVGYMADGMGSANTEYSGVIYVIAWANGVATFVGCGGAAAAQSGNNMKALGCAVCGAVTGVLTYFGGLGANGYAGAAAKWGAGAGGWGGGVGGNIVCSAFGAAF